MTTQLIERWTTHVLRIPEPPDLPSPFLILCTLHPHTRQRNTRSLLVTIVIMAAELQLPDNPIIAATTATATNTTTTSTTATTTTAIIPGQTEPAGLPLAPKRQRRPSVRLGEIGDQPIYDSHVRRTKPQHHTWRLPKDTSTKSIKARSLTNLVNGGDSHDFQDAEERNHNGDNSNNNLEVTHKRVKAKRATTAKRARTNWISKIDEGADGDSREDGDETFRDRSLNFCLYWNNMQFRKVKIGLWFI